jgi:hypothetical protein
VYVDPFSPFPAKQEPAVGVTDGQWIASRAVAGEEVSFEVYAPHRVGAGGMRKAAFVWGGTRRRFLRGMMRLLIAEDLLNGADGRPDQLRTLTPQQHQELLGTPSVSVAQRQDPLHPIVGDPIRMSLRGAAAVGQTAGAFLPPARKATYRPSCD